MNFNFHEFNNARRKRLFIPLSVFSFANFLVPIKFRQPVMAPATAFSAIHRQRLNRGRLLDGRGN
jgi:hypothetical protein